MQPLRSDREQRVVSVLGAMGNDQGTRSSSVGSEKEQEARSEKKESKKRENRGKRENSGKRESGGNLEMKH